MTSDNQQIIKLDPTKPMSVDFSYSVSWEETTVSHSNRLSLYKDSFFAKELEIHWLSVMNSFVLVLLLVGFVALILMRVLKADYVRYSKRDEEVQEGKSHFHFF